MMFASNSNDSSMTGEGLGVWISPGLGMAYPELKTRLLELYRDKVSRLDFVPAGWFALVKKLQDSMPNDLVRIAPSQLANGSPIENMPEWTNSSPRVNNAWQSLFNATNEAVVQFAQQQQSKGKAELDRLYANARFWDTAYKVGQATGVVGAQNALSGLNKFYEENQFNIRMTLAGVAIIATLWVLTPYITPLLTGKK